MPELAALGLVGAIVTFLAVNWNLYWVHRSFQSPAFKTLNHNLSKIHRRWSMEQGRIVEFSATENIEQLIQGDYQRSTRSAFLFGTLLIFMSWLGLLFFMIYFISTHHLAKSALEKKVFQSELVRNLDLEPLRVQNLLSEMESLS